MNTIYTELEAAKILRKDLVTLRNLVRRRKIGFYKGKPLTFSEDHLKDYLKSIEEKPCAENQRLSSSQTERGTSNPPTGTSITTKEEVSAYLRGVSLARKTMKPRSRSQHLSWNGKGQHPEPQGSY